MNFYAFSALFNLVTTLVLLIIVLSKDRRGKTNIAFAVFAASVIVWSGGYYLWQVAHDSAAALFYSRVLMAGAIFIPVTYLHFVLALVKRLEDKRRPLILSYFLFLIFFVFNFSPMVVNRVEPLFFFPFWPRPGVLFHVFLATWMSYVIYSNYFLYHAFKTADAILRAQIKYVLTGFFVGFVGGSTNYFLWYNIPIPPIANILSSIYVAGMAYAITKHQLMDIKVIATELFSALVFIVLLVRFIGSPSSVDYAVNAVALGSFSLFGALLIRSVWKEVHTREKVQILAAELEKANAHLRELDQSKSEFLSIAAHQLRTPITGIKGYVSMFLEGDFGQLAAPQRLELDKIYRASDRLTRLIDVFLNVSRIETGRMELTKTPVRFEQIVADVEHDLTAAYKKKGLTLTIQPPGSPLPPMLLDRDKIQDVVMNLVDNSIKYTPAGSINIRLDRSPSLLTFQIKDTGIGIDPSDIDKLFQKFSRADAASHIQTGGSGLGLFVAKKIVEAHGGRIWAESEGKGQGAAITFTLPIMEEEKVDKLKS